MNIHDEMSDDEVLSLYRFGHHVARAMRRAKIADIAPAGTAHRRAVRGNPGSQIPRTTGARTG
jgi:hypothetical protein